MATTTPFDTLTFVQRLERVGVGRAVAEAHAELARDAVLGEIASKAELDRLEERLGARIDTLESSMTIKFGAMLVAALGVLFAALRLS